jgi:hypothetical protein
MLTFIILQVIDMIEYYQNDTDINACEIWTYKTP